MQKFISGKEAIEKLNIRDFQLLEHVKKSRLQPYDQLGKRKPPPNISSKLTYLKNLQNRLKAILWPPKTPEKQRLLLAKAGQSSFKRYLTIGDLKKEVTNLEEELSQIDNIYSWGNYSRSDWQVKWDLEDLVDSLFLEEEVQKLNKEHGLQYQKESQAPDTSIEKDSQKLGDLKEKEYLKGPKVVEMIKRARAEADFLYDNLLTFKKGRGFDERVLEDPELEALEDVLNVLKGETIKAFTQQKEKFKWVKENHLKNRAIYEMGSGKEKRAFIGKLLQTVVKAYHPDNNKLWGDYERLHKLS